MNVDSLKISKVFSGGGDIHYVLPRFQREYAWEKQNWQTLLDDILSIYEIYDDQNEPEHFMGALVVIGDGNRSGTIPAFKLVDGQQRLTTISLALCALGNLVKEDNPSVYKKIRRMLENEDEKGDIRYKLLPTEKYDDRKTFKSVIDGNIEPLKGHSESRILDAYNYLYSQLQKHLRDGIDSAKLFLVFANCLQVVFIDLDKSERPFEIFESLNAKGKPLTQPDLVRNYIAMMLPEEKQNQAFEHWSDIENRLRESRTVSRIGELTAFLRHYLAYRSGILPNKGHVYARFRDRIQRDINQTNESFAQEIATLQRFSIYYDRLLRPENEPDKETRYFLERLQIVESSTAYPFLLGLFNEFDSGHISRSDFLTALSLVENYLVRRFLANEQTNYTNKMFPTLAREISLSNVGESLKAALLRRNYPNDLQIKNTMPLLPIYSSRNRDRLVFVLTEVNKYLSSGTDGYTMLADNPTVEHIMPQKLTSEWKTTLGENWEEIYRDLRDTVGNLTLVTQSWNSSLSNGSWDDKKERFSRHALIINYSYFQSFTENWDGDAIRHRGAWLTEAILNIWPALGDPPVVISYTGRAPRSLTILGEVYDVTSWRDVAVQTLEFAIAMVDNFENFANKVASAYLTADEKPRSRQLSNGWWLYLNLSADTVMGLCSKVIEQLEMSDEDWEIQLIDA